MAKSPFKNNMTLLLCWILLMGATPSTGQAIDTAMAIPIGGIRQWVSIKSENRRNPVLLFLHGGPGNSVISYSDKFTGALRKHFVVVNWDQRESGKTGEINKSPVSLTVKLMTSDAIEVVRYLCGKFSVDKIYLMGHSWGGFLGMEVAAQRPELLKAYIAVCPMIYQAESERLALARMQQKAAEEKNQVATKELAAVKIPFATGEQLYYQRKWLLHYAGAKEPSKETVLTWSTKWLELFNEASEVNFLTALPRVECPIYFFVGGRDYQTSTKLTTDFYNQVKAPDKQIFVFESTAHNLPTAEPARFQQTIIESVLGRLTK
ncbi:alpha/beta hydrolase [Chryseolinea sp. T2]|uniref:alpha/beta hydrolase n=1 Tax=Chryseolinea sp. T2 TaxID=3129255 RepID=UPI003077EDD5